MSMPTETWMNRLYELVDKFSEYGARTDIAALTMVELWGLYRFLSRVAEGCDYGN